jgi:hypothetical protein
MALTIKHTKVSTIADDPDESLIRPSDWNADHDLTGVATVAQGGTGVGTLSGILKGNGTDPVTAVTGPEIVSAIGGTKVANAISADNATTLNGILPIANGGTNATTAETARTNLGVPATDGTGATGTWGISITGTVEKSNNIAAGSSLQIPFQNSPNVTAFIDAPTASGQFLGYNGTNIAWAAGGSMGEYQGIRPVFINNDLKTIGVVQQDFDDHYLLENQINTAIINGEIDYWEATPKKFVTNIFANNLNHSMNIFLPKGNFIPGTTIKVMVDTPHVVQVVGEDGVKVNTRSKGRKLPNDSVSTIMNIGQDSWAVGAVGLSQGVPYVDSVQGSQGPGQYSPFTAQVSLQSEGDIVPSKITYYYSKKFGQGTPVSKERTGSNNQVCNFDNLEGWQVYSFWACYGPDNGVIGERGNIVDYLVQGTVPDKPRNVSLYNVRGDFNIFKMDIAFPPGVTEMECNIANKGWIPMVFDEYNQMWGVAPNASYQTGGILSVIFRGKNAQGTGPESDPIDVDFDIGMEPVFCRAEQSDNFGRCNFTWIPDHTEIDYNDPNTKYNIKITATDPTGKVISTNNYKFDFEWPSVNFGSTGPAGSKVTCEVSIESYGVIGKTVKAEVVTVADIGNKPGVAPIRRAITSAGVGYIEIYKNGRASAKRYFCRFVSPEGTFAPKDVEFTPINSLIYADTAFARIPLPYPNLNYIISLYTKNDYGVSDWSNDATLTWTTKDVLPTPPKALTVTRSNKKLSWTFEGPSGGRTPWTIWFKVLEGGTDKRSIGKATTVTQQGNVYTATVDTPWINDAVDYDFCCYAQNIIGPSEDSNHLIAVKP